MTDIADEKPYSYEYISTMSRDISSQNSNRYNKSLSGVTTDLNIFQKCYFAEIILQWPGKDRYSVYGHGM